MSQKTVLNRRRTKKYTGCWSCRKRGVKCDEIRPRCSKCTLSNINCEGYSIRLCWENLRSSGKRFDSTRSCILIQWDENDLLDDVQVDFFLERIDAISYFMSNGKVNHENEYLYGPFTVFKVPPITSSDFRNMITPADSVINDLNEWKDIVESVRPDWINDEEISENIFENSILHPPFSPTSLLIKENTLDLADPDLYSRWFTEIKFAQLNNSNGENFLLQYWDSHLSRLMIPISDNNNPYRNLLEIGTSKVVTLESKNVLLHSICSVTASFLARPRNLSKLSENIEALFTEYWNFHHRKAYDFIVKTYTTFKHSSQEEQVILIASITILLTIDVFYLSDKWIMHIKGVLSIVKMLSGFDAPSFPDLSNTFSKSMIFYLKMCNLSYIFGSACSSTDSFLESPIESLTISEFNFVDNLREEIDQSILYQNYGISDEMLSCLSDIVLLIQIERNEDTFKNEILILDIKLSDCKPAKLKKFDSTDKRSLNNMIRYHQLMIFYIAINIYYQREVLHKRLLEIQDIVNEGIDHIEMNEELSKELATTGLFWPCFVICCETLTQIGQLRLKSWLTRLSCHDIGNIASATEIIYALWKRRKHDENIRWITVKRELYPSLLLS